MSNVLFVVNPVAGKMMSSKYMMDILRIFNDNDALPTVYTTKSHGDAKKYVETHAADYDRVVCCGGDGTFSEVVSGIIKADIKTPIGYIAAGSTNDLARTLGIPADIKKAAENAVCGQPFGIDIGIVNGSETFTYVASFGLFTKTSYSTPQELKNILGHSAYVLEGVKELSNIKVYNMTIKTEDETVKGEFIFGAITNSLSIGGVFKYPRSRVSLNDGNFEIMMIKRPKDLIELGNIVNSINTGSFNDKNILFIQASKLNITIDSPCPFTLDGEYGGEYTEMEIENLREKVTIYLPND